MKTFILFIFGMFDDHEDIEFFCTDILGTSPVIKQVRFIIENSSNIIVIFDSDIDYKTLSEELFVTLTNENIKFYFMFDRDSMVTAHIPPEIKDHIFKPITNNMIITMGYHKKNNRQMNLDELLDKIEEFGIESLTEDEKKFLDNFEK
jgi:hypothetical protein